MMPCSHIHFPSRKTEQRYQSPHLNTPASPALNPHNTGHPSKLPALKDADSRHPPTQEKHSLLTPPSGYCFSSTSNNTAPKEAFLFFEECSPVNMPWYKQGLSHPSENQSSSEGKSYQIQERILVHYACQVFHYLLEPVCNKKE